MTSVFLETSALFRAYTREPGSAVMDELFKATEEHRITGIISALSIPEILRGIARRKNLREIDEREARKIIDSIIVDLDTRIHNGELVVLDLKSSFLPEVNLLIRDSNFYVIDAIQLVTARHAAPALFLHADTHFSSPPVRETVTAVDIRKPDAKDAVTRVL